MLIPDALSTALRKARHLVVFTAPGCPPRAAFPPSAMP